jgi:two-component system sensor histidine kinase HydH
MKFLFNIQPRYIVAIAVTVMLVMVISAFIELNQSREEIFHLLQEEASSIAETIDHSGMNNILATQELEKSIADRLFNNANYIARFDSLGALNQKILQEFCNQNNIFRINIFDKTGERVISSHIKDVSHEQLPDEYSPIQFIKPILDGKVKRLTIGLKDARYETGQRYAVAISRTHKNGGAIVLNIDAAELLEFRKQIGIGKLIKDIGDNSGIEYVALQDDRGIVAASRSIDELSAIEDDSLLTNAFDNNNTLTRTSIFLDHEVFEVIKPFVIDSITVGIFRIGFSMNEVRSIDDRMQRRIVIMSIVLGILSILIVMAIVATQNYRISEKKYSAIRTFTGNILEHMQDAVITVDAESRITIFNKQAETLFILKEKDVVGKRFSELPQIARICLLNIFGTLESISEQAITCADGEQRIILATISDSRKTDGSIESRTAVIKDMTNARQLERELQRKDKLTAMGELASGVAHEIRNPINAISMIAQRFEKEFRPKAEEQEYFELTSVIKSETRRINNIIKQFLNFARPPKLNIERINPVHYFQHVSTLFAGQASAKGVRFDTDLQCTKDFSIDREQFTQAILNLLQNALDVTSAGGIISLSCIDDENEIRITVSDTGSGISKEELEKIFNLYYTTKHDGTGMGLAITQQIITQHNGNIVVQSEIGKGSKFTIILPFIV